MMRLGMSLKRTLKILAITCAALAGLSWIFSLHTVLAMYKNGCYWELDTLWLRWRIPDAVWSAVRYTSLSTPVICLIAITGLCLIRYSQTKHVAHHVGRNDQ